jgi:hypothetical protein
MSIILGLQVQPQNLLLTYPYSRLYAYLDLNILPMSRLQSAFKTVAFSCIYLKGGGLTAKFHFLIVRHSLSDFCLNWLCKSSVLLSPSPGTVRGW